jgi:hypothetical protein
MPTWNSPSTSENFIPTVRACKMKPGAPRPLKGKRTLIQTLLNRAEDEPDQLYGSFPLTDNIEDGFKDFTVGELAQAVDVSAWRIKEQYGIGIDYETILYMGVNDFRYTIFTYAAIKCGYKVGRQDSQRL